jgi:phospholipase/carboxylesterase
MNRIQSQLPPTESLSNSTSLRVVEAGRLQTAVGRAPYTLFGPLHYEPNYAYPLIVWLHGPDDSEQQLKRIMPLISLRNYVAVAARGTAKSAAGGFNWRQSEEHIQAADERVVECIEAASEKFNVAADRVFLAGYGSGGTMAFRIALQNPQRVAGVLSFGGPLPTGHAPLAQLQAARRLAVFVACTRASRNYPTSVVCDDLRLLHTAGMSIVLREYPGDDGLTTHMLADMDRWVMEQITSAGSPRSEEARSEG